MLALLAGGGSCTAGLHEDGMKQGRRAKARSNASSDRALIRMMSDVWHV